MTETVTWNKLLRYRAAEWLRYERRCPIIAFERPPQSWGSYRPDVLGITRGRALIEVEIKVTLSDFHWCLRMAENQSGTLVSLAREICRMPEKEGALVTP